MKNCLLFLAAIILCINCQKREITVAQEEAESSSPTAVEAFADVEDIIIQSVEMDGKTIQETIENYTYPSAVLSTRSQGLYAFQIEGNFTGSGNREIIAFYIENLAKYGYIGSIDAAFCFVCDSTGEKVENVYYIKYGTSDFMERNDPETGLVEITDLGRAIIYKDRIIGRVGDFNGNDRDELYLYALSGWNIEPNFFEFNGKEFVEIIELGSPDCAPVISADPVEKVIVLSRRSYRDGQDINLVENINSYIWNEGIHQYELLTSETKNYRFNRTTWEYEEIK